MTKILVIDDSPSCLEYLEGVLSAKGYGIITADDGLQGIQKIKKHEPGIVVTDIIMPNADGIEVIMYLRKNHPATGIIAISAGGNLHGEVYLNCAKKLGADFVLNKPVDLQYLYYMIEELCRRQESHLVVSKRAH